METKAVYAAIAAVAKDMAHDGIQKTRKNKQQGYRFRGIDDVYEALAPMLVRHSLIILPRCLSRTQTERQTKAGGTLFYAVVEVEFEFVCHVDGSSCVVKTFGEAMDSADKATNKAMSAAYKYAAFQTFCIPLEGDNDADSTTHEVKPRPKRKPTPKPRPRAELAEELGGAFEASMQPPASAAADTLALTPTEREKMIAEIVASPEYVGIYADFSARSAQPGEGFDWKEISDSALGIAHTGITAPDTPRAAPAGGKMVCDKCGADWSDRRGKGSGKIAFKCSKSNWDNDAKQELGCSGVVWFSEYEKHPEKYPASQE